MNFLVFHDFLIEKGGGEKVIEEILKLPGKKLLITSFYIPEKTFSSFKKVKVISLDRLFSKIFTKNRFMKVLIALLFFKFFLRKFSDRLEKKFKVGVFSGFYSIYFAPYLKIKKIYYVQAEPLFMVFRRRGYRSLAIKIFRFLLNIISREERNSLLSFDLIISNSKYTKSIFSKYGIFAEKVVYPPVDTKKFKHTKKAQYFLYVGRLYPHKRVDLVARVFSKIKNERLKIAGTGPLAKIIETYQNIYKNIKYLGFVSEKKLVELFSKCKAVIYIPEKEHFGMVPVEANASGKPAIISDEGGIVETIIPGKTGIVIKKPYERNLEKVVREFGKYKFDPKLCIKHASKFDRKVFRKKFERILEEIVG